MVPWCKVASDLDTNPKIRRAGRLGREVYLFALRRYASRYERDAPETQEGTIPHADLEPWFVADILKMSEAEAEAGLLACVQSKLLQIEEDRIVITGNDSVVWSTDPTGADRARRYRERKRNGDVMTHHVASRDDRDASPRGEERREEEKREDRRIARDPTTTGVQHSGTTDDSSGTDMPEGPSPERAVENAPPSPVGSGKEPHSRAHALPARNERPLPDPPVPALTTASVLMDYLLRNHPESKLARCTETQRENTLLRWAHDVRLMHEADHLEYGAIQAMIHWCQRDKFWSTVIISAGKLRDKWDQMAAQRRRPALASAGKGTETPAEVEAKWAKAKAASQAETERIRAHDAAVAAERAKGDPALTPTLDDGADSGEDEPDVG